MTDTRLAEFMKYARGGWMKGEMNMSMGEFVFLILHAYAFIQLDKFLSTSPDWAMPTEMQKAKLMCEQLKNMEMDGDAYDA